MAEEYFPRIRPGVTRQFRQQAYPGRSEAYSGITGATWLTALAVLSYAPDYGDFGER